MISEVTIFQCRERTPLGVKHSTGVQTPEASVSNRLSAKPTLYNANLVKATLKVPESRIIAGLLLEGADAAAWRQAIVVDNVLQKRSAQTATTFANFIARRLRTLNPEAWAAIRDGSNIVSTQLVLAATIKYSRLVRDFLDDVVRDRKRRFQTRITDRDWAEFMEQCKGRDPAIDAWSDSVVGKLCQNTFRICAEAGYVTDTKTMTLQRMVVAAEVESFLTLHGETEALRVMEAGR